MVMSLSMTEILVMMLMLMIESWHLSRTFSNMLKIMMMTVFVISLLMMMHALPIILMIPLFTISFNYTVVVYINTSDQDCAL
jgi:hypothetical protein